MKNITKFDTYSQMVDRMGTYLMEVPDTVIVGYGYTILNVLDFLIDVEEIDIVDRSTDTLLVYAKNIGDGVVILEDIFDEDGNVKEIECSFCMVEDEEIDNDKIDEIYVEEELLFVDYEDYDWEDKDEDMERDCSPSKCGCCECQCEEDLAIEQIDDMLEEYTLLIQETEGCPGCIKEILAEFMQDVLENFKLEEE